MFVLDVNYFLLIRPNSTTEYPRTRASAGPLRVYSSPLQSEQEAASLPMCHMLEACSWSDFGSSRPSGPKDEVVWVISACDGPSLYLTSSGWCSLAEPKEGQWAAGAAGLAGGLGQAGWWRLGEGLGTGQRGWPGMLPAQPGRVWQRGAWEGWGKAPGPCPCWPRANANDGNHWQDPITLATRCHVNRLQDIGSSLPGYIMVTRFPDFGRSLAQLRGYG